MCSELEQVDERHGGRVMGYLYPGDIDILRRWYKICTSLSCPVTSWLLFTLLDHFRECSGPGRPNYRVCSAVKYSFEAMR